MKKLETKIWHFLLLFLLLIVITSFDYIISFIQLLFNCLMLCIKGDNEILNLVDIRFVDAAASVLLLPIFIVLLISVHKLRSWISKPLSFSGAFILILIICFLFAPLITKQNPDFQKNISVTKLLPPFSSVKFITLKEKGIDNENEIEKFISQKRSLIPESYNDNLIFVDSLKLNIDNNSIEYYQNNVAKDLPLTEIISSNGYPKIKEKFFLLGSDEFGRDIFTRIIYGSRISLLVGFGSVLLSLIIGVGLAFAAAQRGGVIDLLLNRLTDLFLSFPTIFLVILILALFGSNIISVIIVLGLSGWMSLFKVVKSEIASVKKKDYFISAELIGLKNRKLLIREILPVIIAPVIVNLIFQFSNVILAESALSYLGLGTGSNYPSWGAMIESGQEYILQSWWMIFIPGVILILTLLSVNSIGRKINSYYNPKLLI